jgi:[ribosomal protein S18]-alanine N-acetyltransferase
LVGLVIVPLQERHLDDLVRLERICFSEPWSRAGLEAELYDPVSIFAVAQKDGETAGYAGMHCVSGECYVDNVAVFPQYRGLGIGLALMRHLILRAENEKAEFISLEVRASNMPAISLYEKIGFRVAGRRRDFYRRPSEDALILTRFLN